MFGYHSKGHYEMFALCLEFIIFHHRDYSSVPKPSVLPCCLLPSKGPFIQDGFFHYSNIRNFYLTALQESCEVDIRPCYKQIRCYNIPATSNQSLQLDERFTHRRLSLQFQSASAVCFLTCVMLRRSSGRSHEECAWPLTCRGLCEAQLILYTLTSDTSMCEMKTCIASAW